MSTWQQVGFDDIDVLPFFTDLHINGYGDVDLLRVESVDDVHKLGRFLYKNGTHAYQPSLITAPIEETLRAISFIESARRQRGDDEAEILGIHLEGPFLAPEMAGAHPVEYLKMPDRELISKYLAAGTITMVTLAPELPGAIELIAFLSMMGIKVSLGHTGATHEIARAGFRAGASSVTHLYNRCSKPFVDVAIDESDAKLFLIADGSHVDDERIADTFQRAGDRVIATTDSISTRGLGEQQIEIRDGAAYRTDGVKAGSIATMRSLWERIARVVGSEAATEACATRPACYLGRPELGSLSFGYPAQRPFTT